MKILLSIVGDIWDERNGGGMVVPMTYVMVGHMAKMLKLLFGWILKVMLFHTVKMNRKE